MPHAVIILVAVTLLLSLATTDAHELTQERVIFQTIHGDITFALWPKVAPVTSAHIMKLAKLGAYNTVPFFRVDKGFVAQCSDIIGNRKVGLTPQQEEEANMKVPLEVRKDAKHDRRGILSMARWDDPNSGAASFSITLGAAPHLDMRYAAFGEVTDGWATLDRFEEVETKTEGIFVMPVEPIEIKSMYVFTPGDGSVICAERLADLQHRFDAQALDLEKLRAAQLPG